MLQFHGHFISDSEVSSVDKSKSSSTGSNVTLVSRDTWGGLAPKNRPSLPRTSDEVVHTMSRVICKTHTVTM